jgi:hypothetical protein
MLHLSCDLWGDLRRWSCTRCCLEDAGWWPNASRSGWILDTTRYDKLHSTPGFWPIGPRQLKDLKGHRESARHAGSRFRALRQKSLELRQKSTESAWICLTSETSLCWCFFFTLEDIDHWVEGLNISDFSSFGLCVLFSVQSTVRREHIIFPSSWVLKALGVGRCFLDGNWEEGYV